MIKKSFLYLTPLLLLLTLLILYQWSMFTYAPVSDEEDSKEPETSVQINHQKDLLQIEQSISNLDEETYSLEIPSQATELTCEYEEGKACLLDIEKEQTVTTSKEGTLHFSFTIPIEEIEKGNQDWMVQLKQDHAYVPLQLTIEVTENQPEQWMWISPTEHSAIIEKKYIRYYEWQKNQATSFTLSVLPKDTFKKQTDGLLTVYTTSLLPEKSFQEMKKIYESLTDEPLIVMIGDEELQTREHMIALDTYSADAFRSKWYLQSFTPPDGVAKEQEWLLSAIVAYASSTTPDNEKGKRVAEALSRTLSDEEKHKFLEEIKEDTGSAWPKHLDEALGNVIDGQTSFFELNGIEKNFVPLYFIIDKEIHVNGESKNIPWNAIRFEGDRYFPLGGFAPVVNISVTVIPNDQVYILRKNGNEYRFSLNKETFIKNQEAFGIARDALIEINQDIYMKGQYIQDILGVEIREGSSTIYFND